MYLGHIILNGQLLDNICKISAIADWPQLKHRKDL